MTVQNQALSSADGILYSWVTASPDWAASSFPGPGSALHIAVAMAPATPGSGGGVTAHSALTGLTSTADHAWAELAQRPQSSYTASSNDAALADARKCIITTRATAISLRIRLQSAIAWLSDTLLCGINTGAGVLTLTAEAGVTLNGAVTVPQNGWWWAKRTASDVWQCFTGGAGGTGDLKSDGSVAMAADLNLGGNQASNAGDAVAATDLTTLQQVTAAIAAATSSLADWKSSVRAATTANITLSGAQTIDGVSVIAGDRVLVKNQTTGSQNGIYVCASGAWARSTDCDASAEVTTGLTVVVEEGTVAAGKPYILTTANPITLGTTALTFTQLSSATGDGTTITSSGGTLSVATGGVGNTQLATGLSWSKFATAIGNLGFTGLKSLSYNSEIATTGATPAVDFTTGDLQKTTLTANCTPTFTAPAGVGWVQWSVIQDTTPRTITFPGSVVGSPPQPSTVSGSRTFYPFFYDGTNYHYSANDTSGFLLANGSVPLTAAWAVGNFALTGLRNLSYTSEVATTGATPAVNFTTGDLQKSTLNAATVTPTFTAPPGVSWVQWHVQQDGTGGRSIVFPGTVLGAPPPPAQGASAHTFYDFFWDGTNYHYTALGAAGTEVDNGNSGTSDTIDLAAGTYQKSTLTGNCTFTFLPPSGVGTVQLRLIQDSNGARTATWPANLYWSSGGAPTLSTTPGDIDIISIFWDGTNYYGTTNKIALSQIVPSLTNGQVMVTVGGVATWSTTLGNSADSMVVNGVDTKIQSAGTTFLHAVSLSGRKIVGLFGDVTTTQMPANTGDGVVYMAARTTVPTVAPVGGLSIYATATGQLCTLSTDSNLVMKLGDGAGGIELRAGGATVPTVSIVANSGGGASEWGTTFAAGRMSVAPGSGTSDYAIQYNGTNVMNLGSGGKLAFFGTAAQSKQTITGSRGGNAALADLLTKLATIGLITDSSS